MVNDISALNEFPKTIDDITAISEQRSLSKGIIASVYTVSNLLPTVSMRGDALLLSYNTRDGNLEVIFGNDEVFVTTPSGEAVELNTEKRNNSASTKITVDSLTTLLDIVAPYSQKP